MKRCKTCNWWVDPGENECPISDGLCRRHSPCCPNTTEHNGDAQTPMWPWTLSDMWCGDYEPSAKSNPILAKSLGILELSCRSRNALMRARYDKSLETVGELCELTSKELLTRHNFGITSLKEIQAKLEEHGLKLAF